MERFIVKGGYVKTLLGCLMVAAAVIVAGCDTGEASRPEPDSPKTEEAPLPADDKSADDKPLLLDDEPLLLSDNPGNLAASLPPPEGPVADNSRCLVCHMNFSDEELAVRHARANVGCEKCHGSSDSHCDDENNITPPSIMYPRDKIDAACTACHDPSKLSEIHFCRINGPDPSEAGKVCTDCHGKHRLAVRTVRWDKVTRKLLNEDSQEQDE